ncbi:MAG: glutamine amidotransferase [Steroidobacteraceae bacterium]
MRQAVAIQHVAFEDLGTLAPALRAAGFETTVLQAGVDDLSSAASPSVDLLIILGGPIGVYEQAEYPFLVDELKLIALRIAAGKPIIGICLGAQLMAAALGAKVFAGDRGKEIGWSSLSAVNASDNPLSALLQTGLKVLHWHGDTFELPAGATHLASSAQYANQAFSLGDFGLALQFHPEVTARQLERWLIGHAAELSQARISVSSLRADNVRYAPALEKVAQTFWQEWLIGVFGK